MNFTVFFNLIVQFIQTLPPLFVATVVSCLAVLLALAIKRIFF